MVKGKEVLSSAKVKSIIMITQSVLILILIGVIIYSHLTEKVDMSDYVTLVEDVNEKEEKLIINKLKEESITFNIEGKSILVIFT